MIDNKVDESKRSTVKKLIWTTPILLAIGVPESVQAIQSGWITGDKSTIGNNDGTEK